MTDATDMGCTVTRSKMARNIAEGREEFSQNDSMAEEGDREKTNMANVGQDMQEKPNKPATRTVADFSWLSNTTAEQSATKNPTAPRLK